MNPRAVTNLPRDAREAGRRNMASQFSRSRYARRRLGARIWALVVALAGGAMLAAAWLGIIYAVIIAGGR